MRGMRWSLGLPVDRVESGEEFVSAEAVAEMATAAERYGFDAVYVTDHPAPPAAWLGSGGHHALEPTVALSFAAAATSRVRVHTNLYVAAYRPVLLAAKTLASLDLLSGGRLIVGLGAGYLRAEFEALGADFDDRGTVLDDAIAVLKRAWTGEPLTVSGRGFSARDVIVRPTPAQRPHPPLWIGGNSSAAMRRAVRCAQGWSPFLNAGFADVTRTAEIANLDDLQRRLAEMRVMLERDGRRDPLEVCFTPPHLVRHGKRFEPEVLREEVGSLTDLGVTWATVEFRTGSRNEWLEHVQRFSSELLA